MLTYYTSFSPFTEMRRLQQEMNRLFDGFDQEAETFPAVNVWSNKDAAMVRCEVPGIDPNAISISVQGDQLTLEGERKPDEPSEEVVCHRAERGAGKFVRPVRLPFEVNPEKVEAHYQYGVLTITLPRAEASKPRQIKVTS